MKRRTVFMKLLVSVILLAWSGSVHAGLVTDGLKLSWEGDKGLSRSGTPTYDLQTGDTWADQQSSTFLTVTDEDADSRNWGADVLSTSGSSHSSLPDRAVAVLFDVDISLVVQAADMVSTHTHNSFSIEVWMRSTVKNPGNPFVWFERGGSSGFSLTTGDGNVLGDDGGAGTFNDDVRFCVGQSGGGGGGGQITVDMPDTWNTDWMQVVGVYDGTAGSVALYLDGVLADSASAGASVGWEGGQPGELLGTNGDIGGHGASGVSPFSGSTANGSMAIVRSYERALSAGEVWRNYRFVTDPRGTVMMVR